MTIRAVLSELEDRGLISTYMPVEPRERGRILASAGVILPPTHLEMLAVSDGAMVCGGYFRIFGLSPANPVNLLAWNAPDLWKFAWGGKADDYFCFGETAWGDQTAYKLDELGKHSEPTVYMLDGHAMEPSVLSDDFQSYFETGFRQNAIHTYSNDVIRARRNIGDVTLNEHVVFVPSILITGAAELSGIQKMDAVTAMILNGDIYQQIGEEPVDRLVRQIQPYTDALGRTRVKVIWADE